MSNKLNAAIGGLADAIADAVAERLGTKFTGTRAASAGPKPARTRKVKAAVAAEEKPAKARKGAKKPARARKVAKPISESKSSDTNKAMFADVLKFISENPNATMGSITTALGITDKRKATYALATLRQRGHIVMEGDRRSASYKAVAGVPAASNGAAAAEA